MFIWHRAPDPSWVEELRHLSPPQDGLSHLELWWEPGHLWGPVQRWVLYELIPVAAITNEDDRKDLHEVFTELQPCSCDREWREIPDDELFKAAKKERVSASLAVCRTCKGRKGFGFKRIYDTYHQRGYYAQPFWVIQGERGGHKLAYNEDEAQLASAAGMSSTAPVPGSLPYADWDWRVKRNLQAYDLALSRVSSLKQARAEHREMLARAARQAQEAYLNGVFEDAMEHVGLNLEEVPRVHGYRNADESEASARYIETGEVT